jgi:predicted dehydrogenase
MELIGAAGRIAVDLRALTVRGFGPSGEVIADASFEGLERNALFLDEMRCFLGAVQGGAPVPADLHAGRQSLEMALAIRRSMETRAPVELSAQP